MSTVYIIESSDDVESQKENALSNRLSAQSNATKLISLEIKAAWLLSSSFSFSSSFISIKLNVFQNIDDLIMYQQIINFKKQI